MLDLTEVLKKTRIAARSLRTVPGDKKDEVLKLAAKKLIQKSDLILKANSEDIKALPLEATPAFRDRLLLNAERLQDMARGLLKVAELPDPVGEVAEQRVLGNHLRVRRERSPLGVILMIFESRPNVALEAFSLAFKAGNAILLRGGKESHRTTAVIYDLLGESLAESGVTADAVFGITDPDRELLKSLLKQKQWIDVVVPRGGDSLIEFVVEESRIPIIKNDRGMCHLYVHEDADLYMAEVIIQNAKTQRPGVCNSLETILIHRRVASELLPLVYSRLAQSSVQWFVCPESYKILSKKDHVSLATPQNFLTEYLDFKINCLIVEFLDQAIEHIELHGSKHSETILTSSSQTAREFENQVDAAVVYWNASSRFTDGFELGLGGELGISTQKLHARGPIGLRELTSLRWIIEGDGQTRKG